MPEQTSRIVTYLDEIGHIHPIVIYDEKKEVSVGVFKTFTMYRYPTDSERKEWELEVAEWKD